LKTGVHVTARISVLAFLCVAATACGAPRARLNTDAPLSFDPAKAERVRVLRVMEERQVLIERRDGTRFLFQLGNGCLQSLPDAAELDSVPTLVESPSDFAGAGAKLVFPLKQQGCWILRSSSVS